MNTRQQDIISLLEQRGEMTIKSLAETFGVTEMTIHRDLDYLEKKNYLFKKRGAAVFINSHDRESGSFYVDEKRSIGQKVAELIKPGQSILFDNSTTALEVARFLDGIVGLTFYTTNLETAAILSKYPNTIMYCSGGYYFPDSKGFIGKQTESFVESVHADLCIIGASGIDLEHGVTGPYPMHTSLQRKIIDAADYHILAADHSKFGKAAIEKIADLDEIDCIVTDSGIRAELAEEYGKHTRIILA